MNEEQGSLNEVSSKFSRNARETSRLAGLKAAPRSGSTRRRILVALVLAEENGLTDDEISNILHISPNTVRPRRLELVEGFWVRNSDMKRPSNYGNPAIVWLAAPKAVELIKTGQLKNIQDATAS